MSLPSSGYASAVVTNPGGALTDFTLLIDLADLPASWWAAVDTADGTKGRAAKSDGTELPCDWIDFDNGASTGWVRVKWSGTLAAAGTQTLRIYPPVDANASVAAGDTYGQYAAYDDDWQAYLPLAEDFDDRTSNGIDGTAAGGMAAGDSTGPDGFPSAGLDDTDDYVTLDSDPVAGEAQCTVIAWTDYDERITSGIAGAWNADTDMSALLFTASADHGLFRLDTTTDTVETATGVTAIQDGTPHMAAGTYDGSNLHLYIDGAQEGTEPAITGTIASSSYGFELGRYNADAGTIPTGSLCHFSAHSTARSADWIAEEYAQTNDNTTFWGTWEWTAAGTPGTGRHADAMRVTASGAQVDSLRWAGSIPGVVPLAIAGRNGPGYGRLRSTGDGTWLAWTAPGSATPGVPVYCGSDGTYLLEDGADRSKWIRVQVYASYLGNPTETRVALGDRWNNPIGHDDVTESEADAGDVETYTLTLTNDSAVLLSQIAAWLDDDVEDLEISDDGSTWVSPTTEATGLEFDDLAPGYSHTLHLRRTIAASSAADPDVLNHVLLAFSGL